MDNILKFPVERKLQVFDTRIRALLKFYEYSDDEANRQAQFIHDDSDTEGYPSEFEEGNKKRTVTDNDWSDPESSVRPSKKVRFD